MTRPRPGRVSVVTRPFWEATAEGKFLIQRCTACAQAIFYPRPACPHCGATELTWEPASGAATVYTFSIARRPTHPKFTGDEPYVVAIVELAEGPHVTTNIVDCDPADVHIGMAVQVSFEAVGDDGYALPVFGPA